MIDKLMTSQPLVSVLIPCYNSERWVAETLDSVLAQSWINIEVIVVDDGSTDHSIDVVKGYVQRGIKLICQSNKGAAAARNAAFLASRGEYVQFLDADDLLSANKIESQLRRLIVNPDAVAVCQWGRFYNNVSNLILNPDDTWRDLDPIDWLVAAWINGEGTLFPALWLVPREVVVKAGPWREDLSLNDDGEFFTRVVLASKQVLYCNEATAYYRSGIFSSLSKTRSIQAWQSGFMAIQSCVNSVMQTEDSARVRRCCALLWQVYAHSAYPYEKKLANEALKQAARLHNVKIHPDVGRIFRLVSNILGWRIARFMQKWSGRP